MTKSESVLEMKEVTKQYDSDSSESLIAIQDIDLKIEKGEFVCILGPSGCGKSTLLNILAGFQPVTFGAAFFRGEEIKGPSWERGVVFQSPTLYPWLSVQENVAFGPEVRGLKKEKIEKISLDLLDEVGLKKDKDKAVFDLSGGMKQRVALARVLANQPEVILMDEPLGALDALTRLNMQGLIRNLWRETGNTVIMITHDVDEALSLATRLLVMSSQPGRIEESYRIDFTSTAFEREGQRVKVDDDYLELKDEILNHINTANNKD
ncbi:MAG: ABC transporter ATP-binding protein [Atopostipes suicloacalis]|nr:ABC transporter ATP-binding protein [Atopostipes suicloacalis]